VERILSKTPLDTTRRPAKGLCAWLNVAPTSDQQTQTPKRYVRRPIGAFGR
jgi:hypothetical protein